MIKLSAAAYELLYAKGDIDAWLQKAHYAGANSCRFFAEASWMVSKNDVVAPFLYSGGRFDLSQWEPRYWTRLGYTLNRMKTHSIRPHIVLFDYCSWKMRPPWVRFVPWFNSIQDPTNKHLVGILLDYQKKYVRRIVALCVKSGIDAEYEICNEYYWRGYTNKQGFAWHKAIVETLMAEGVPRKNIITSVKWDLDMDILTALAKQVGVYAFHGAGARDGEILWRAVEQMKKAAAVELSSDGVFKGQGAADNEGHCGNNESEMRKIARLMKAHGITRYDFKDRGISDKSTESSLTQCGVISNVDLADLAPLTAMAEELGVEIPIPPVEPPDPPEPPEPPQPPEPPVPNTNHVMKNISKADQRLSGKLANSYLAGYGGRNEYLKLCHDPGCPDLPERLGAHRYRDRCLPDLQKKRGSQDARHPERPQRQDDEHGQKARRHRQ